MSGSPRDLEVFDLAATSAPVARVRLFNETYDVFPASGRVYHVLDQLGAIALGAQKDGGAIGPAAQVLALTSTFEVLEDVVPDLPADQRQRLTPEQAGQLLALSCKQVDKVREFIKAHAPNVESPAASADGAAPTPLSPG
jgi:hypothetical protein